ncbi:hypothetical protein GCM10010909_12590 [Acidocella aquatica]|uniref:Type IV pilus biogenesis protein PilP n=1 Tax=Acidocella aquatica TaxID=1922313 RepID=A0ABQ6A277_9PROT|nr:hypothetical protein [Acidocella aquatica]GLR66579.1 hypothetical protein GCM10010909_12590 [Acidocella aquatica]
MNSVTVNSIYNTDPDAHEVARLPGEALDHTESDKASEQLAAPGTDGLFAEPDQRSCTSAKNNFPLYAGVGMVALLMAAGYFIVHSVKSHHPLQATQTSTVHLAQVPPISIAQLAPSASLAKVPLPKSPPAILHQKYVPQPPSAELSELDGFRLGAPPDNLDITQPQTLPSAGEAAAPSPLPLQATSIIHHPATPQAASTGLLAAHTPPASPNPNANPTPHPASPGSPFKVTSISAPKPTLALIPPAAINPGDQVSAPAKYGTTPTPQAAPAQAAPAKQASEVTLAGAMAGSLSPAQQTELFQLVTELATMERDDRIKQAVLTGEVEQLSALTTNRLEDYDRRLSMLEAQTAVSGAMQAGSNGAVEAAIAPAPLVQAPVAANASNTSGATPAQAAPAVPSATVLPSTGPAIAAQYHVQAASPGLAMLSVVGGDGSPLVVQVGNIIPGYGKVLGVVQQGDSWVVQTQSGNIE